MVRSYEQLRLHCVNCEVSRTLWKYHDMEYHDYTLSFTLR